MNSFEQKCVVLIRGEGAKELNFFYFHENHNQYIQRVNNVLKQHGNEGYELVSTTGGVGHDECLSLFFRRKL